jgi:histidinol dehydrogenase
MRIIPKKWKTMTKSEQERILRRSAQDIEDALKKIGPVIEAVRNEGDRAVIRYTVQFDGAAVESLPVRVSEEEFAAAEQILSDQVKSALRYSIDNVRRFHEHQRPHGQTLHEIRPGVFAGERPLPIDSAGLYVPRGRGSFPSMLYMLAVPAQVAGVPRIVVATPPARDGSVDPACLYAARLCGVASVYRMGGAQAVAALAYGTETVRPVAKIVGPGSVYVAAAKRLVSGTVDTGLPAGPSESVVLADGAADPGRTASDLLIEAEHGSDSSALLVTPSGKLAGDVADLLPGLIDALPEPRRQFTADVFSMYGGIILTETMEEAAELVNDIAPEHLQIQTNDPFDTLSLIRNAGEILLGENTPFSAANYSVGANAVLPTGGTARSFSAVSVRDFIKYSSVVYVTSGGLTELSPHVITLADYEGFAAHSNALKKRE